ncbi:type ISP restriction/modification enzyme [Rhizobium sp. RM]|uniref:DEAD/DEAH box helicase n=1 Tax=Rhizobium sp. RM TaxID=2748079 RepID=UPI00110DB052|nr:type ISP restriction/modification enzyme [Rhizobium sp. RM]NWJ26118.1 DEAD/DEAH box helicase [Rhizobium sp. RM]TMV20713.1 DEAD/DEAH box helicase [Rhizobium sp. Td3]
MQLSDLLDTYRTASGNEREKGDYFERVVKVFLQNDSTQKQYYSAVVPFGEWAKAHGWSGNDTGIDLVATLADGSGYAAIQCKFYAPEYSIQKADLDSFISAASSDLFKRLIIADTTRKDFSRNAKETLGKLSKEWNRIGTNELEASRIDWSQFVRTGTVSLAPKKELRDHQREALQAVAEGLQAADRGKLIMACGTGKTFTGLRIAETLAGKGKRVLFMVPSLALMSQTVREWKNDCQKEFTAFSACSDTKIGRNADADSLDLNVHDLAFPATTEPEKIARQVNSANVDKMTVVFSTYHSIDVLTRAQKQYSMPAFDLVICDEAHRTTGVTLKDEDDSAFVRIHSNEYVAATKRLYMTATPRIFGDAAKRKADDYDAELASMDDEAKFGKDLFHRGFGWAVENDLLTDYKVVVLAVDEGLVSNTIQNRLKDGPELTLDDATKIIGCYKALTKSDLVADLAFDPRPMKRALAFCQSIAKSQIIEEEFTKVVAEYAGNEFVDAERYVSTEVRHVDGSYNASAREELLNWLKADAGDDACRILTNAKVLSEGVDVPALDAIMFMHPRKSQIDVVQSVGRVMRRAEGKKLGYVILPVAIPPNTKPEDALNDNERYKIVWQILNALRAHDERLDARINQAKLGEDISDKIELVRVSSETELKELTTVVEDFATSRSNLRKDGPGIGRETLDRRQPYGDYKQGEFLFDEFTRAIMAKIVEKCGTRDYWDTWAKDIAKIAQTHITRISTIVANPGRERDAFVEFLEELRDDLNPEISEAEAIEMLAQHLITKPVFDALFKDSKFTTENPVSKAMEIVLGQLHEHNISKESESLAKFYTSVERRAADVKTARGRQKLITELYDKFFGNAFPMLSERLGIVYTPVEVVDFILHSVNDVLKSQFGQTLGSKGVHILDPFTGTGTFIARLLQSGLIAPDELEHKYKNEIHANEIVLLAYYIAAINIETVYHELAQGGLNEDAPYQPFTGILLTDTFQMYEQERDMVSNLLPDNSQRRTRQKELDIRVIIGNPPYSGGQENANDDAPNISYPQLDTAIRDSYAASSTAKLKNQLYNSYIRAFRWASDRIGDAGVMGFVSGSAWIERGYADGMRKCLADEFSNLYVFHLRGDIRKNMLSKGAAREGQNVFGSGSMTGICIAVLTKNPKGTERGQIYFHDIGPDLTTTQKLNAIRDMGSINGITRAEGWKHITPDEKNDWLDQVDSSFDAFIEIGSRSSGGAPVVFETFSNGVSTQRDVWVYGPSSAKLHLNVQSMISAFNSQIDQAKTIKTVDRDARKIKWSADLETAFLRSSRLEFRPETTRTSMYRPFEKKLLYYENSLIERAGSFDSVPEGSPIMCLSGKGSRSGFSVLMVDAIPNYDLIEKSKCFPLYLCGPAIPDDGLFASALEDGADATRRAAITDAGLAYFQTAYLGEEITKEDVFYYIYGLLHSPDYRRRFANNLSKQLPRIPAVSNFSDFKAFQDAGRTLSDLHINFETAEPYMVTFKEGDHRLIPEAQADPIKFYRVTKMKFASKGKEKDRTTVVYNDRITMQNVPLEAYDYVVNGKPALEWVMERQVVKQDKDSGIITDANDYANEIVGDPKYLLTLFQRMITVSIKTMAVVHSLPRLDGVGIKAEGRTSIKIDSLKAQIVDHWSDMPAGQIACGIVDAIAARDFDKVVSLHVSDILHMLDAKTLTGDIIAALNILVQSDIAIFRTGGKFIDDEGVTHELSSEQFQRVLDFDTLFHPVTKAEVEAPSSKVVPFFQLTTQLVGGEA